MPYRHRRDLAASRRRVEDEGDEEGGPDHGELDDDSLTEGSIMSEDEGSETSNPDAVSPESPGHAKVNGNGILDVENGKAKSSNRRQHPTNGTSDMDMMLNGLKLSEQQGKAEEVRFEDLQEENEVPTPSPAVVSSTAQMDQPQEQPHDRRRREHEEYKRKRDADPAFVPNRGAFFMHDHRHAGPAANGFRPFGRGRGRGRGIGGPFAPVKYDAVGTHAEDMMLTKCSQIPHPYEPTDAPWAHDMHEVISEPQPRHMQNPTYGNGISHAPARAPANAPETGKINRALSTTKHVGNVQIRLFFSTMEKPISFPGIPWKQYTRLPDHRPPLRRDKPVRISLPDNPPRYIYPAIERSFIFIPRAMRPNQQGFGGRGRGRSVFGSIGGYSRRTSVFGGSVYGSQYAPSVAMSRRSSLAREVGRDDIVSPSGSTMSRPQIAMDPSRPVVKLPPASQSGPTQYNPAVAQDPQNGLQVAHATENHSLGPAAYPHPQIPSFPAKATPNIVSNSTPTHIHQPRPQKTVSVADIESPATLNFNPPQQLQQPFHQQVPLQVNANGFQDTMLHTRNASYPSQASTGTPLSQIPERAIHAQPFQPNPYQQQGYYPQQPYQVMPPQPGYYYPQQSFNSSMGPTAGNTPFMPAQQQQQPQYSQPQPDAATAQAPQNLVAQEVNGMVYYYDAAQIPAVNTFPTYPAATTYPMQQVGGVVGMGGMMTPSPDGFYYPQAAQGVVYYSQ
ncbi:hypothetical protein BP6252_12390 [Coleophoma cylindrospora]|uniref:Btz domain-containing protein n=1 Tax=Coleophoma cylindrospora TaxID=1849047 RepID=A0A3D8QGY9_9HELO|nr:hypothetical protein BP6252_12390 [Coleophoma cylindrospora]